MTELTSHSEQAHPLTTKVHTAFMHGRPAAHPAHALYARAVGADFYPVDPIMRWHDRKVPRWYRYLSWIVCSLVFAIRRRYSVWLSEGSHIPPVLIKHLTFPSARPRIITHLGDATLYFLANGQYSPFATRWILRILNQYDAIICEGRMQADIAMHTLGLRPPIHTVINGVPSDRCDAYRRCRPEMGSANVIIVANGPGGWKTQYKGLDLAVSAVVTCRRLGLDIRLTVVGEWDECTRAVLLRTDPAGIKFIGYHSDLAAVFATGSVYLHPGRGDAFPLSVLEAMASGLVPIVSEWTGAKEVVEQVDAKLVCPLDARAIAKRIEWFMKLPLTEKIALSDKVRKVVSAYTEERAVRVFTDTFERILGGFDRESKN